ncbi:ly6/PLAUR domain-containing protein 6 [Camelus ferus]|nr:ly6/PLAUR domain-containing protein 6 [Camelus ferus]
MEAGPALAWLLLLSLLADCLKATQSRDFTVKDIVYLHPSTTPYPGGFKCFTCEKAADNYECNRWAPDIYCPRGAQSRSEGVQGYPVTKEKQGPVALCWSSIPEKTEFSLDAFFRETRYCYTQHTMEVTGNSISVTKRCVPLEDCLSTGCRDSEHEGHKVWATKQVTALPPTMKQAPGKTGGKRRHGLFQGSTLRVSPALGAFLQLGDPVEGEGQLIRGERVLLL